MRREGRSKYNKIYTLQSDLFGQRVAISVTSVSGHLMNWQFYENMSSWQTVPVVQLFDAPVKHVVNHDMKAIEQTLREEAQKHDILVVWTDCDREGEAIGAEIVKVCQESNRRIDIYRARFSEITSMAINRAARNLIRLDDNTVAAVDCRSELDLRIGSAFTRLQTLHLKSNFRELLGQSDNSKVISYGSCQFPTLGFVVERYKLIQNFVSEQFWKLGVDHVREGMKVEFLWDRNRLFDRDVVDILYDNCLEHKEAIVEKVVKKPKSKWRPQALDTVELEKLGISKLKMSAKQTMQIAEKLYSKGFISYPRTETNKFPAGLDLRPLVTAQTASDTWGDFADQVLQNGINPRNGRKSDEAHPPIHPLIFADRNQLTGDDWRVYELVVRHFLACVSQDAQGEETTVNLAIGCEKFHASGLRIKDQGYLKVYVYERWGNKNLPGYEQGEKLEDYQLRISDGNTQPPDLLTEADLIGLMDKYGIGTDATHAEHIEKIKIREYIGVQQDGRLMPSFLGLALVDGYDDMGFAMSKPDLRANLEIGLKDICEGRRQKNDVLDEQIGKYKSIFVETERNIGILSQSLQRYLNNRDGGPGGPAGGGGRGGRGGGGGGGPPAPRGGGGGGGTGRGRGRPAGSSNRRSGADAGGSISSEMVTLSEEFGGLSGGGGTKKRAATTAPRKTRGARGGTKAASSTRTTQQTAADGEGVMCNCAEPVQAVMRTVMKEGPNKGKKFWTCPGTTTKCNFFKWA